MKHFPALALLLYSSLSLAQNTFTATIDLNKIRDDKAKVTFEIGSIDSDSIEFHMPKIVPGTYSISDFGRFISDLKAYDQDNNLLESEKLSTNRWIIRGSQNLDKIEYWVDDSFDRSSNYKSNYIFEPGGTNIDAVNDVYIVNTFGFIGYLDGYKMSPYELRIKKKKKLYGATALNEISRTDSLDVFEASNYHFLADGPLMYTYPDTVKKEIGGTEILVSVYSPTKQLSASDIMDNIEDLMMAQSSYLGGDLPVDKYAYLIYLTDKSTLSNSMGALEHSYSSVYTLPDARGSYISQTIRDVAAHEFLHIVTPLNIHSEQIHNFNYIEPEMSKHLWLYEGVTEYSSMHVQVRNKLYDEDFFLGEVREKILTADQFPLVSFTEMSEKILDPEYERYYSNVYYKGALIAMCLDLYLIKYSEGKVDLPSLLKELSKEYGPQRAFNDDELFDIIEKGTYPEVREFLDMYVAGDTPLPLEQCLGWAGVDFIREMESETFTLGNVGLAIDSDENRLSIDDLSDLNSFGKEMGYKKGDIILEINGNEVFIDNANQIIDDFYDTQKAGKKVKVKVKRKNKELILSAKATTVKKKESNVLRFSDQPTTEQEQIREAWLGGLK